MAEEISLIEYSGRPIAEVGRYSGVDQTYQEVVAWTIREGYRGVIFEVSFLSTNYPKTEWRLTFKRSLTGTLTFTNGLTAVTGAGTAFSTELEAGDEIWLDADETWATIDSVETDTALTLTAAYGGTGGSGAGSHIWGFYDEQLDAALTLTWNDNKLASETEVSLDAQSSDGTSITVNGSITGKLLAIT